MPTSSRIVFFGNERLSSGFQPQGAPTLQALLDNGYNVVAIVASHHEATSRKKRQLEVQEVAEKYNIPVLLPQKPADITDQLLALKPDVGVLVAYGRIVPQSVIDIFPHGIVNIHPSLLPLYRGSTPIEQAILDGASQTGVSLMQLTKAMDAGPIFDQAVVKLSGTETKTELTQTLLQRGGALLIQHLPEILADRLQPTPQDESKATFCSQLTKDNSRLDTTKTATQLEREIRAYAGWPKTRTNLIGHDVIVTRARVTTANEQQALVLPCASNTWLEILEVIGPSGKTMSAADFIRGYKK